MDKTVIEMLAQHQNDRRERAERKRAAEKLLHDECLKGSPRYQRAMKFSHQIMALVRDYIPDACTEDALRDLALNAISLDVEIAQVPPEREVLAKAALDAAMSGVGVTRIAPFDFFAKPETE